MRTGETHAVPGAFPSAPGILPSSEQMRHWPACHSAGPAASGRRKSFRTDMMHTVNSVAAAKPYLEKSKSASIIIVSSEVAAGVVFLASPVASRVSGTNLIVDGALTKAV